MDYFIALDAGHSYFISGKETPIFPDGTKMKEWEFNWAVVKKIYKKLESYSQIDVFLTNTEKYDVTLDNRCDRANRAWQAYQDKFGKENVRGVLVSVHANAMKDYWNDLGNGTATFYYKTNMTDKAFAEVVQKNLIAKTKLQPHRGGVVGDNFQIIRDVTMTACLCECGFMDNLEEAKLLRTDEFREACAEGIVNGLLEYFNIKKIGEEVKEPIVEQPKPVEEKPIEKPVEKTIYSVTPNQTHLLCGNVKDFGAKIVNKSNRSIEEPNVTNGSFFWYLTPDKTKTYSTSIFIQNGKIIQGTANHYYDFGCPQNVFIIYNDNRVEMKKVYFANQLDYQNIKFAMGGIGLRDTSNPNFKYDPASEGFKWGYNKQTKSYVSYADVLRKTNKIVMGYNIAEDKLYLMVRPNIFHSSAIAYDLLDLVKDCKFDIACSYDGSGSVFMNNADDMVVYGDGRRIYSIIGWGLN